MKSLLWTLAIANALACGREVSNKRSKAEVPRVTPVAEFPAPTASPGAEAGQATPSPTPMASPTASPADLPEVTGAADLAGLYGNTNNPASLLRIDSDLAIILGFEIDGRLLGLGEFIAAHFPHKLSWDSQTQAWRSVGFFSNRDGQLWQPIELNLSTIPSNKDEIQLSVSLPSVMPNGKGCAVQVPSIQPGQAPQQTLGSQAPAIGKATTVRDPQIPSCQTSSCSLPLECPAPKLVMQFKKVTPCTQLCGPWFQPVL